MKYPEYFTVIDTEGSGGKVPELLEIAIIKFTISGEIISEDTWLIKPTASIPKWVSNIHGIYNNTVKNCPYFDDVKDEIISTLSEDNIVAHNASTDINILKRYLPEWMPINIYDTLKMARKLIPESPSFKLDILYNDLISQNKKNQLGSHRALDDALKCKELFIYFCLIEEKYPSQLDLF